MELRHLRYFVAVAGSLNFTRAAERVHVTQSTLSHQIRQLEEELGQRLLERNGRRVTLTEAGDTFLIYAVRALQEVDKGMGELKSRSVRLTGMVRIGTTHTFNMSFIPQCVALFLKRHPTVKVVIEELNADDILTGLHSGKLDLGVAYRPGVHTELRFEPLYNEELALVVGADHPLASRRRVRMVELHREALVMLPTSFSTRRLLDESFQAAGAEPVIMVEMNSVAAMLDLASRIRIGAIIAPSSIAGREQNLRVIALESPTPVRTPGLLFSDEYAPTSAGRAFAALIRRHSTKLGNQGRSTDLT